MSRPSWAEDDVVAFADLGMLDDPPSPRACCHTESIRDFVLKE